MSVTRWQVEKHLLSHLPLVIYLKPQHEKSRVLDPGSGETSSTGVWKVEHAEPYGTRLPCQVKAGKGGCCRTCTSSFRVNDLLTAMLSGRQSFWIIFINPKNG